MKYKIIQTFILLIFLFGIFRHGTASDWQWQNPYPQGNTLKDIYAFDTLNAIAVGLSGTIIKTGDGGKSWDVTSVGNEYHLYSVYFFNKNQGNYYQFFQIKYIV